MPFDLEAHFGPIDIYLFDQLLRGQIAPGMRVLDAGCGSGRNLIYLLKDGYDVTAVDADASAVAAVQRLAAEIVPGFPPDRIRQEPLESLSFPDASFDVVICSAVLHFARDDAQFEAMVRGTWRVLKPGGIQIYTVPLIHNRSTRQRMQQTAEGGVVHLLPPSFHGNEGEFPVVWEFGGDFFEHRKPNITELDYDNYWQNRTVFTVVERKP